jgi:hypothetical protein
MSIFAEFGRRVIRAREKQAERQVSAAMLNFDDETLAKAGLNRAELVRKARGALYY